MLLARAVSEEVGLGGAKPVVLVGFVLGVTVVVEVDDAVGVFFGFTVEVEVQAASSRAIDKTNATFLKQYIDKQCNSFIDLPLINPVLVHLALSSTDIR
ncbi:MAG: hypothetical protein M1483_00665 [Actinobacteria bacterium]|nr:hypothetical protein [Actinomycetota bacterium]MCL6104146.1 hypothetical protein [Actinomycetota bacterium]